MRGFVLGFASLLLAVAATAAQGQSGNVGQLEGCWQLDEVVTTKLDGEAVRRKVDYLCRYWIGAEKITNACRDRLGLVRQVSESPYEMLGPDKLLFRGYRTPEDVGFEQQRLRRTVAYSEVTATERVPNPEIRRDSFFTRVPSDADRCLPQAGRVAAKDAWSIWQGPDLAQAFRRGLIELEFAMRLRDRDVLRIPADGLRPEDRTRAVEEFWKILDRTAALGMADWDKQAASLDRLWSEKNVCSDHSQTLFLASPEVRQWAADITRETIALQRVAARFAAAMSLFPEETKVLLQEGSKVSRETEEGLKRGLISELLLLPRAAVVAVAERPELARVFDSVTDFAALRDLGKRNAEFFDRNGLQTTHVLRCPGQLSASVLSPGRASLEQAERVWKEDLGLLKARIAYASDPNVAGWCSFLTENVSIAKLEASNGDMRLVTSVDGVPLAADASQMFSLSEAYARGCRVPQDMKRARQILEGFAVATKTRKFKGKLELAAWCRLAHWYRQGFGGPKDAQAAESWEQRVKAEILPQGCNPIPPVDPSNPWKVL
jgi:hypothetical protein